MRRDGGEDCLHHLAAIRRRIVLGPMHGIDILVECGRALGEPREVAIGQVDVGFFHLATRALDEVPADDVADAARSGVQHHPDVFGLVEADLDEVVAAAEGAELSAPRLLEILLHRGDRGAARDDALEPAGERARRLVAAAAVRAA